MKVTVVTTITTEIDLNHPSIKKELEVCFAALAQATNAIKNAQLAETTQIIVEKEVEDEGSQT